MGGSFPPHSTAGSSKSYMDIGMYIRKTFIEYVHISAKLLMITCSASVARIVLSIRDAFRTKYCNERFSGH